MRERVAVRATSLDLGPSSRRSRLDLTSQLASGRRAEHLPIERLPVRRDPLLRRSEGDQSGAHDVVELVLELVLDVVARVRVRLLREQVGDVVRAADLEPNLK
jgi:hypothetical protein